MIYCDTSYLVRLYLDEPGANEVRVLCSRHEVACSMHGLAEVPAALHRSWREGRIGASAFTALIAQFQAEVSTEAIHWLPLADSVQVAMAARYATLPPTTFLRAADALHLACAAENQFREVYSNDRHFLAAAPLFGIKGRNIIPC